MIDSTTSGAEPIAKSEWALRRDDERRVVRIQIWAPEPDPESKNGDFRCKLNIAGLPRGAFETYVFGVDGVQSLGLTLNLAGQQLWQLETQGYESELAPGELARMLQACFPQMKPLSWGLGGTPQVAVGSSGSALPRGRCIWFALCPPSARPRAVQLAFQGWGYPVLSS